MERNLDGTLRKLKDMKTLRETIKEVIQNHLDKGGLIGGQCLSAVGFVNNTIPDQTKGVIEAPMSDVGFADIMVGTAIAGRRPIVVIRFQDFLLLNGNALIMFAAKRKEIFGKSCPIFVRAIAREGNGTGNSHSGKLHSMFMHFPGLRIWAPITPLEYKECWKDFMEHDDPLICFEHALTLNNKDEMQEVRKCEPSFTLFGVSYARMNILKAADTLKRYGIDCDYFPITKLRPFQISKSWVESLQESQAGLVVDTGFETCGAARDIAYQLTQASGVIVGALGLEDKSVGVAKEYENLTPSVERIIKEVFKKI